MTPPQVLEAAEKFWKNQNEEIDTNNDRACFQSGVDWLFNHLCELSELEFDPKTSATAMYEWINRPNAFTYAPQSCERDWVAGAHHQKSLDMAALLKAREELKLALKERDSHRLELSLIPILENGMGQQLSMPVEWYFKELKSAKQEIARLRALEDEHVSELAKALSEYRERIEGLKDVINYSTNADRIYIEEQRQRLIQKNKELEDAKQELLVVKAQREKAIAAEGNLNILIGETRSRVKSLEASLTSLRNEAAGFISMANPADHGNTNMMCLRNRIDEAYDVLKGDGGEG